MFVLLLFISFSLIIKQGYTDGIEYPEPGTLGFAVFINSSTVSSCSGTIISPKWVLTAASCVHKGKKVTVYAGMADYKNPGEFTQKRASDYVVVHPEYKEGLAGHDLALVLVDDFEFNSSVSMIPLADVQWPTEISDISCISFGFGGKSLEKSDPNTKLKMWSSSASYGDEDCLCMNRFQWRRLLCVKRVKDQGLCGQGDYGSGLVCYHGENPFGNKTVMNNSTRLFGVAHKMWNINSCKSKRRDLYKVKCGDEETQSTYMYLCPYLGWLGQHVIDTPRAPPTCGVAVIIPQVATIIILIVILLTTR